MLTSSISSIPDEILAETFILAKEEMCFTFPGRRSFSIRVDEVPAEPLRTSHSTRQPSFAQVNRHWRAVAIGCSRLWRSFAICWSSAVHDSITTRQKKRLCKLWIRRSGVQPLSIAFLPPPFYKLQLNQPWVGISLTKVMLNVLLPHVGRLRFLYLRAHLPTVAESFENIGSNSLTTLEMLSLGDFSGSPAQAWWFKRTFSRCANLRVLWLENHSFPLINTACQSFPWNRITHFYCDDEIGVWSALTLLTTCSQLEEITLTLALTLSSGPGHQHPHATSSLKHLTLKSGQEETSTLFTHIMFPNLETFHCGHHRIGFGGAMPLKLFESGFMQARPPLTTLYLNAPHSNYEDTDFITLFFALPRLEHLVLRQYDSFLGRSTRIQGRPWLSEDCLEGITARIVLPQLKSLRLECPTSLDELLLAQLVIKRILEVDNNSTKLEYLFVVLRKTITHDTKAVFKRLGLRNGTLAHSYTVP